MKHTVSTLISSFLIAILQLKVGPKTNEKMDRVGTIKSKFDSLKCVCLFAVLLGIYFLAFATAAHATTYEQTYYADGADHFKDVYLAGGGTHSFFVNGVPWGSYNYVGYKNTGSGYTQIWSDSTSTGWDPTFSTYVSPGYKVKLVIYDGSWNVKSVYYWYIYSSNRAPSIERYAPSSSTVTLNVGQSQNFKAKGTDPDSNIDYVRITSAEKSTETNYCQYSCDYQYADITYSWDSASTYTVTATAVDKYGLSASTSWTVTVNPNPSIISAYWWMPLDVSTGDEVTMCAEVQNIPVGTQCIFKIFEDDFIDDDEIDPPYPTGNVYQAENGKTYVKATWTAQWQNDGGINPWAGDPEHFFEVSYGSVSLKSSRSLDQELIVRNDRQEPSMQHGDFYYSSGEATQESTQLTDSRIPLILVHGMSGDKKQDSLNYWYAWCNDSDGRFNQIGMKSKFKVHRYVYDSRRPISENGTTFAQFVNQFYDNHPELSERQVVIMAHSMGGLVSRYALNTNSQFRNKVHRLVTLGTPHLGSPGANPTWLFWSYPGALDPFIAMTYEFSMHDGTEGFFDLAWHSVNEIPSAARAKPTLFAYHHIYNDTLLDNSLSNPFCRSSDMQREDGDSKIIVYGGYFSFLIDGDGDSWPETVSEEVEKDHRNLFAAKILMLPMVKQDGSIVGNNDGLVPITSALLGTGHANAEKINLTQSLGEAVDHSSYLDVGSTMDIIADRLNTMVKVTILSQAATDAGARWRIAGGAWQKSGASLNALKQSQYTIEFKDVPGWTKPSKKTVTISNSLTTNVSGTYTPTGVVLVGATPNTASWTVSGPSGFEGNGQTYTGDRTFTNAPVGSYTWTGQAPYEWRNTVLQ